MAYHRLGNYHDQLNWLLAQPCLKLLFSKKAFLKVNWKTHHSLKKVAVTTLVITLQSHRQVCCKVFKHYVLSHLEGFQIISDEQFGF